MGCKDEVTREDCIPTTAFHPAGMRTPALLLSLIAWLSLPAAQPNVLLIMVDDMGWADLGCYGSPTIRTPHLDRMAAEGVRFTDFYSGAEVCSPSRAALLTGRNQHRVGFGSIAEYPGPFPGYTAAKPRSCAGLPRIMSDNGYVTGGFGKWHLTPDNVQGPAGPFDHWPQAWGFDHWWGFLTGAAGQYDPVVVQDNTNIGVPEGKDGKLYYFPDDPTHLIL